MEGLLLDTPVRLIGTLCRTFLNVVLCGYSKFRIESNSYFGIRFDSKRAQLFEIFEYLPSPISYLFNRKRYEDFIDLTHRHGVNKTTIINRDNYSNNVCHACLAFIYMSYIFMPAISSVCFTSSIFQHCVWNAQMAVC